MRRLKNSGMTVMTLATVGLAAPAMVAADPVEHRPEGVGDPAIKVDASEEGNVISPYLFGANQVYAFDMYGAADPATGEPYPEFVQQVRDSGVTSIRYPGGTAANLFRWKDAIGPLDERRPGPVWGFTTEPTFGPDEFGGLVEDVGAVGAITVNLATEDADSAADWVEYMTAPLGTNPRGGTAWAAVRAQNGHPEPYDVPYWTVANEPWNQNQQYWRAPARFGPRIELYAFGGTTTITDQPAVRYDNYDASSMLSDGSPGQTRYAQFAPVVPGSQTVTVGTASRPQEWTEVDDLSNSGAQNVYEFDPASGKITFGDGVHGNIPPEGHEIRISYDSGPHDGFVDFYREMKEANPDVQVCSAMEREPFYRMMGEEHPWDCLDRHIYAGTFVRFPDGTPMLPNDLPIEEYHYRFLTAMTEERVSRIDVTREEIARHAGDRADEIDIIVQEYGQLGNSTPDGVEGYHRSMDQALYNAETLRRMIELGDIDLAMRHQLTNYVFEESPTGFAQDGRDNAMISGPGPDTVSQPQAHVLGLYSSMTGDVAVETTIDNAPTYTLGTGDDVATLTALASTDDEHLYLIVNNLHADEAVEIEVEPGDYVGRHFADVRSVTSPSYLSSNSLENPDVVTVTEDRLRFAGDEFSYTFPAHSVTAFQLPLPNGGE